MTSEDAIHQTTIKALELFRKLEDTCLIGVNCNTVIIASVFLLMDSAKQCGHSKDKLLYILNKIMDDMWDKMDLAPCEEKK